MAEKPAKTSRPVPALLLGLAATAVVALLDLFGVGRAVELQTLDFRFRYFATAPPNDEIVHVDIDDRSTDEVGRWPWPRALQAGIVDVLFECGASAVALDIIMPEPQETRYVSAEWQLYIADVGDLIWKGEPPPPQPVFDDAILVETFKSSPSVFLPMYVDLGQVQRSELERALETLVAGDPNLPAERARADVLEVLKGPPPPEIVDDEAFAKLYLRARSLVDLRRFAVPPDAIGGYPARSGSVVPPLATFVRHVQHTGFVTVDPDPDGVVRHIPLLARSGEYVYPHFALALAAERFSRSHGGSYELRADASSVTIQCPDGAQRVIPVDSRGDMLINWVRRRDRHVLPRHVPARAVAGVWQQRHALQRNTIRSRLMHMELLDLAQQNDLSVSDDLSYVLPGLVKRLPEVYLATQAHERELQRAILFTPDEQIVEPLRKRAREAEQRQDEIEQRVDALCEKLLGRVLSHLEGRTDPASRPLWDICYRLQHDIPAANRRIQQAIATDLRRISQSVTGKICLVGSTGTGAADFVPTPMARRTPGVVVHGNIFNTIVSGAFVRKAHPAVGLLVILLAGAIISLLAATRPVMLQAGPAMLLLAGGYAALNMLVVFWLWNVWLVLVAPLGAMVASFLVVSAYRQLTEERAKRHIRGMFAHALSPALVDRLIADPDLARLGGEKRVLSCFFSDLSGFTTISEQLGERDTVRLLNRYFDRMTEVIQSRHGGYLNKFLGDGIFAFFGAPVPQPDHARRALAAALDCQNEIAELNEVLAADMPHPASLTCRIGISTGEVMVGNCGSTQRMDYTAIGDPVNVASRLETANKAFGTRILVAEESLPRQHDDEFFARPLGQILVVGKNEPVSVWNVIGRAEQASGEQVRTFADFAHGLELFSQRQFEQAAEIFQAVLDVMPDDVPARMYRDLARQYLASPPGDGWLGALRLAEK